MASKNANTDKCESAFESATCYFQFVKNSAFFQAVGSAAFGEVARGAGRVSRVRAWSWVSPREALCLFGPEADPRACLGSLGDCEGVTHLFLRPGRDGGPLSLREVESSEINYQTQG